MRSRTSARRAAGGVSLAPTARRAATSRSARASSASAGSAATARSTAAASSGVTASSAQAGSSSRSSSSRMLVHPQAEAEPGEAVADPGLHGGERDAEVLGHLAVRASAVEGADDGVALEVAEALEALAHPGLLHVALHALLDVVEGG